MEQAGKKNSNNSKFQFWQQSNHPIELSNNLILEQKMEYIHKNPVKAGFTDDEFSYTYSSARDYSGTQGLLELKFLR